MAVTANDLLDLMDKMGQLAKRIRCGEATSELEKELSALLDQAHPPVQLNITAMYLGAALRARFPQFGWGTRTILMPALESPDAIILVNKVRCSATYVEEGDRLYLHFAE